MVTFTRIFLAATLLLAGVARDSAKIRAKRDIGHATD